MLINHIMDSTFKLREVEKFVQVDTSHDITQQEREQCKQLVAEAKQSESEELTGEYIYRVTGPPETRK